MKKFAIQAILLVAVIGGALLFFSPVQKNGNFLSQSNTTQIQINNALINAEIADTPSIRNKGLGGREFLASNSGMLFVFDNSDRHNFWMKGMKIPLDFIWILDNKVVDITENVPAPAPNQANSSLTVYSPKSSINKVLEVNAGFTSANNIKVGDTVIIK